MVDLNSSLFGHLPIFLFRYTSESTSLQRLHARCCYAVMFFSKYVNIILCLSIHQYRYIKLGQMHSYNIKSPLY
jgi:hypothetical protein